MSFNDFRFDPRIDAGIRNCGYTAPTPIQQQTINSAMAGRDVMGLAQTGTGKTAAFALPVLHRLLVNRERKLRALVLAPTRELAEQICDSFTQLGQKTGLRVTTIYGGVGIQGQVRQLQRGTDVVVACPGRLLDHIRQRTIDLRSIDTFVLDEADMMLDMGFLPDIRSVIKSLPNVRQNLMFSATMPDTIRELASTILHDPVIVKIQHSRPVETVTQALFPVTQDMKTPLLMKLLSTTNTDSVLIFTRTKHRTKKLCTYLEKQGYKATSLQGNLSQNARQAALAGFRSGRYNVLVATDIAARGIDVSQVSHVINYDIPQTTDAYTHRIGRTGRASRTGDAFTLITREDETQVRAIERLLGSPIERRTLSDFDYKTRPQGHSDGQLPEPRPQGQRSSRGSGSRRPAVRGDERRSQAPRSSSDRNGRPSAERTRTSGGRPSTQSDTRSVENRGRGPARRGTIGREVSGNVRQKRTAYFNPRTARANDAPREHSTVRADEGSWQQPRWSASYHRDDNQ